MYRLLIVDDEEIITDSLFEVLTQTFGDKLDIYKAYSAKEALAWLNRIRVDIVLTDIRMPGMNGLELMNEVHKLWPHSKITFLTGHSEFEYAYTAIQHKNVKYLLKTEGYNVVIRTINEIIEEINDELKLTHLLELSVEHEFKNKMYEQESVLRSIIFEEDIQNERKEDVQLLFEQLQIPLSLNQPVTLVLTYFSLDSHTSFKHKKELVDALSSLWNSYMSSQFVYVMLKTNKNELVWLIQPIQDEGQSSSIHINTFIEGNLELIQAALIEKHTCHISFTISEHAVGWGDIENTIYQLRELQRLMLSEHLPLLQTNYEHLRQCDNLSEQTKLTTKLSIISSLLETGRQQEFYTIMDDVDNYIVQKTYSVPYLTELYYTIALYLLTYINKCKLNDRVPALYKLMKLDDHVSIKDAFYYLRHTAETVFSLNKLDERKRASMIIEKICEYIQTHLSEDLSLLKLAEIHYFNPSYLSRFFKQEHGLNISEYIEQCRIKKAKALLEDSEYKIRDVSLLVGYEAAHSFTRFFKKVTGMTPQEYRDMLITNK